MLRTENSPLREPLKCYYDVQFKTRRFYKLGSCKENYTSKFFISYFFPSFSIAS